MEHSVKLGLVSRKIVLDIHPIFQRKRGPGNEVDNTVLKKYLCAVSQGQAPGPTCKSEASCG